MQQNSYELYVICLFNVCFSLCVRAGLHNLDSLGLAHNKLRKVPSRVFSHLTLLNSLELDGNNIDTIDPEAFVGLDGK